MISTPSDLVTSLFDSSARPADLQLMPVISARAAFQDVLHERCLLVDARPRRRRTVEGEVSEELTPIRLDALGPADQLKGERVVVLGADALTSSAVREVLVRNGARRVEEIGGGFGAWLAAGLPVATRVA